MIGVDLSSYLPSEYDRRARLVPIVLLISPAVLAGACWFEPFTIPQIGTAVLLFAFLGLLANLGRDRGKSLEPKLFECWGGKPSVQLLRHRSTILPAPKKDRYRERLSSLIPNLRWPSAAGETSDPGAADDVYETCSTFLRTSTRDIQKFRLLFDENINYGFRRNLWALKPAGIFLCSIGLIASCVAMVIGNGSAASRTIPVIASLVNALMLVLWLFRFKSDWVRVPAFAYAERLLEACDMLQPEPRKASPIHVP